jgi:carbon storage regulator
MLYLARKVGESIIINNNIELTVMEVKGKAVKIGFRFPPEVSVLRKELHDRIIAENREAASGGEFNLDDLL